MVLKAVGLLLSILDLSFVSFTPIFFFLGRVPCYSLQCTITLFWNTGTCPHFRVKHGTKFWFAGSAFSAPSQHRNWRIFFSPYLKLRSTQKNENTRSHQNRSNYVFFFALHETLDCKVQSPICPPIAPQLSPPPESG